jgi:2'-5' RNA ligase
MTSHPGAVNTQRLFFALWPEEALQSQIARMTTALLPNHLGRRVSEANLHCTLVFLGTVRPDQRLCVEAAADTVRVEPFTLTLDRFGYFRRPQVAWLGCQQTPPPLLSLVSQLGQGCAVCGFPPEHRDYAVHLTVARRIARDPGQLLVMPIDWPITRFALVASVHEDGGLRYHPQRFWELT